MKYFCVSGVFIKNSLPVHTFLVMELEGYPTKKALVDGLKHQSGWIDEDEEITLTSFSEISKDAYQAYMSDREFLADS